MSESKRGLKDKLSKYNDVTSASLIKRPTQTAENNPGTTHVLTIDEEDPPFCGENTRGDLDSSISFVHVIYDTLKANNSASGSVHRGL